MANASFMIETYHERDAIAREGDRILLLQLLWEVKWSKIVDKTLQPDKENIIDKCGISILITIFTAHVYG